MSSNEEGKSDGVLSYVTKILAIGAVFASLGGVCLHLAGYIAQKSYLLAFNIDPDGFTREADWLMVNGYYSTIPPVSLISRSIFSEASFGLFVFAAVVVVAVKLGSRREPAASRKKNSKDDNKPQHKSFELFAFAIESFLFSVLTWAGTYALMLGAFMIFLIPGAIGETAGADAAAADASKFAKGCQADNPCAELWKDDKPVASGFVLATSSEQIAFYDVRLKLVRQLERSGMEVRSHARPKPGSGDQTGKPTLPPPAAP
ncbi:hypothetical protein SAMN04487939_10834 [Lysobacter sp. yr284]|uniref:hypothetical protein n=1 Tax=Lysobacter sp. yr284 TaxID=1761791 RepID=UPI00089C61B2|nr:hypothetical protein [Lysobacter sp. yr284]SDY89708.1 hypothetical protein SAMN04487939_10834 [Lysobacter sp. yr284]